MRCGGASGDWDNGGGLLRCRGERPWRQRQSSRCCEGLGISIVSKWKLGMLMEYMSLRTGREMRASE